MNGKYKNKDFLKEKYINERLTIEQIADITGKDKGVIRYWLRKFKLHKKKLPQQSQRRRNKIAALEYMGNSCMLCGYNRCERALEFHHVDPAEKRFTISSGLGKMWKSLKAELNKCVLICCNCHREVHSMVRTQEEVEKIHLNARNKRA